ncbi:MAG TPA: 6-carboxytetrahydropterin synthase [Phycisphaerales bacterium]|nr:6-carboxytetrahydropterin synthase [Phycisphaerales bacterium]
MFQVSVEREFCAAHALDIQGVREPVHGHNFRLIVAVEGERLDADGLLLDFHALERLVDEVIRPLNTADLNASGALVDEGGARINPTAEAIARHIGDRVGAGLAGITPDGSHAARLAYVRLTEAPGCAVVYSPESATRATYPDARSGR